MAAGGQRQWASTSTSRLPGVLFAGRVLVDADGVGSSASRLSATRITYRKGRKERRRKRMKERHLLSHTSRPKGLFFSSSPAALDAIVPPGSYSGKRDTDPVAHKLPTGGMD